jgi:Flp pilus assembly protein TadG
MSSRPSFFGFFREETGAVGSVLMICMLPMFLTIAGMAIDGSAAYETQPILQVVADASALAAGQDLSKGVSVAAQTAIAYAQKNLPTAFNGNVLVNSDIQTGNWNATTRVFTPNGIPLNAIDVVVRRSAANSNAIPTSLLGLIGVKSWDIPAQAIVTTSSAKLRVSLALDNSGSMCEPDNNPCPGDGNPNIKINALKTATANLLTMLKNAAGNVGDITVSIVPFTTGVNVGKSNKSASWLTFAPWDAVGSGYGTYATQCGRNGCAQVWQANDASHSSWSGCVMDRNQNYDTNVTLPTGTTTRFPAAPAALYSQSSWALTCPSALIGQTDVMDRIGWSNLNNTVNAMQAGGATNQTIGLSWAWMLMTQGSPISNPGALPADTQPILILLSDGLNTQNRWTGDGYDHSTDVDARMSLACANAKAAGVKIYTVFVDLGGTQGNSSTLQNCASDSSKYFDLTQSSQIITTFNQIGDQITKLRIVQ